MRTNTMALYDHASLDVVQMSLTCGYPMQHFELPMTLHYDVGEQITPHFTTMHTRVAKPRSPSLASSTAP